MHLDLPSYKISARSRKRSVRYALPKFFSFWLRGTHPWAKIHQKVRRPAGLRCLPSCKIHRSTPTHARDIRYQNSCGQKNKQKNVRHLTRLAYIPTCRSPLPQLVYNTRRRRASSACFSHGPRRSGKFVAQG